MKKYKVNGLSVYDFEGNGKPLILVHAFPMSSTMWKGQVEYFQSKFRIITYDVRGLGDSITNDWQFTMETYADDLLGIIDYFKLQNVNVCGLSMGGYIIQRAVVKNPDVFNSIILADTRSERDDDNGLLNRSNTIISIKAGLKNVFIENFLKVLISEKSAMNSELKNSVYEIMNSNSELGICGAMIALATRTTTTNQLSEIDIPALVIVGKDDILTPLNFAELMHSKLKNSKLVIIENSGHMTNIENPTAFNSAVENFLKGID